MKNKIKPLLLFLLLGFTISVTPVQVEAQCPMCRMSAESNLQNGGSEGKGLNTGILYMLSMPYLLVGTLAFLWWRHRKREHEDELEQTA